MHCIGTSVKSILQKLAHGMNHSLKEYVTDWNRCMRYQNLSLFIHFWNLKYFDNRIKCYCVPFRRTVRFLGDTQ